MKYLTTLEVARRLGVAKQTILNWLYTKRIPEPPRNKKGYRLWNLSRVRLIERSIGEGRLHRRTIVHVEPSSQDDVVAGFAREVHAFLRDGQIDVELFLKELSRLNSHVAERVRLRRTAPRRRP
ncbi:MAG: hypothetical protein MUF51_02855 [Vicinamibacteria bacterium]|jgi:hypothetical protein|nr:hypothetical protein [Vicinamibacteria bacterium]